MKTNNPTPFQRGRTDCLLDHTENAPFSSIGGPENRNNPRPPKYINKINEQEYLDGYIEKAIELYGKDWKTITFEWKPTITITHN